MGRVVPDVGPKAVVWLVQHAVLAVLVVVVGCGDDSSDGPDDTTGADMATPVDARPTTDAPPAIDLGPIDCDTPGDTQTVPCGFCGTRDRFCNASGEWEFTTECAGEGVCAPGTTRDETCGSCGTRTVRCTDSCVWDDSATCMDEGGDCVPGERRVTTDGCPSGEYREVTCNASCTEEETLECGAKPQLDIVWMIYLRFRGSSADLAPPTMTNAMLGGLTDNIIGQLMIPVEEQLPSGSSYFTAVSFYTDFVEPTNTFQGDADAGVVVAITELLQGNDATNAIGPNRPSNVADIGDWTAAGVEALHTAFGGPAHDQSIHVTGCSPGREGWLCWRPRSTRVVVLVSDVAQREGPVAPGEAPLDSPGVAPPPATWADTVSRFDSSRVIPYFAVFTGNEEHSPIDLVGQHRQMALDLGLDPARHVFVYGEASDLESTVSPAIGREIAEVVGGT